MPARAAMALVVAASKPTSAKTWAAVSRICSMRRWPRACRRRFGGPATCVTARPTLDNASYRSYSEDMRALTHVTGVAAPDYALRVPLALRLVVALGLVGGLVGLGLLLGASRLPALLGAVLLGLGLCSAALALALGVITSPRLRQRARRRMLEAIAWRGDERVLDVGCGNGFLLI